MIIVMMEVLVLKSTARIAKLLCSFGLGKLELLKATVWSE